VGLSRAARFAGNSPDARGKMRFQDFVHCTLTVAFQIERDVVEPKRLEYSTILAATPSESAFSNSSRAISMRTRLS